MARPEGATTSGVVPFAKPPGESFRAMKKDIVGLVCQECGRTYARLPDYVAHQKIEAEEGYVCASPRQLRKAGFKRGDNGHWTAPVPHGRPGADRHL